VTSGANPTVSIPGAGPTAVHRAAVPCWDAVAGSAMKAAVCERYGPPEVVQIREVPKPVPADGDVRVKADAATVNSGDTRVRALRVPRGLSLPMRVRLGFTKPKQPILGFAGVRLRLPRRVRHRRRTRSDRQDPGEAELTGCGGTVLRRHDGSDLLPA